MVKYEFHFLKITDTIKQGRPKKKNQQKLKQIYQGDKILSIPHT